MPSNNKPHDKFHPYELSDSKGRVGCYEKLKTASDIGRASGQWYQIRNLKDEIIENG